LRCLEDVDAIFCPIDELAALCVEPLKFLGRRIPEDVAIIGFDNAHASRRTTPALSSVQLPIAVQAHAAIDLLLKILKKEIPYGPGFHEIETELVIRESTVKTGQA